MLKTTIDTHPDNHVANAFCFPGFADPGYKRDRSEEGTKIAEVIIPVYQVNESLKISLINERIIGFRSACKHKKSLRFKET